MGMPHRKPTPLGTLFLVIFLTVLTVPGVLVVAHDMLAHRPAVAEQHQTGD